MNRRKRTQEELRKASDHLHYEVWMFTSLASGLASGITGESVINNALLESFTIHARVLLDFLYAEPRYDDVIAEDFFASPELWREARPPKSDNVKTVHKRVGKEIAHLTYARQDVTPETKGWGFSEIVQAVQPVVDAFLGAVPQEFLGSRWERIKGPSGQ